MAAKKKKKKNNAKAAPKKAAQRKTAPKKAAKKRAPKKAAKKRAPKKAAPKKAAPPKQAAVKKSVASAKGRMPPGGAVGWHDLMTTDVDRAQRFYTQLLPWKTRPVEVPPLGLTRRIEVDATPIGGLVALPASEGIGSHWMPYVIVKDLDAVVRKARELSGYVPVPPTPLTGIGRFAVIADPRGAHVSPLQLSNPPPPNGAGHAGKAYWSEVLTDDLDTTTSFFADVFGWQRSSIELGDGKYTVFLDGAEQRAGAIANPTVAPQWLTYFLVDQIDGAFAKAQSLGAVVVQPVNPIPGLGRAAVLKDPTGALFALFEEG